MYYPRIDILPSPDQARSLEIQAPGCKFVHHPETVFITMLINIMGENPKVHILWTVVHEKTVHSSKTIVTKLFYNLLYTFSNFARC